MADTQLFARAVTAAGAQQVALPGQHVTRGHRIASELAAVVLILAADRAGDARIAATSEPAYSP